MKCKREITQLEVIKFFWNNLLYNRCYIHQLCNNCLYLQFENDIEYDYLVGRFQQFCKDNMLGYTNIFIEHREFVRGHFRTNKDYQIWFPIDSNII